MSDSYKFYLRFDHNDMADTIQRAIARPVQNRHINIENANLNAPYSIDLVR